MLENKMQSGAYKITFELFSVGMGVTIEKNKLSLLNMSVVRHKVFFPSKVVKKLGNPKLY